MDRKQVDKIAELARLDFPEDEKEKFTCQLEKILEYVDKLKELDTEEEEPVYQSLKEKAGMADDILREFAGTELLTRIAPDFKSGHFSVKKIIE